MNPRLRRWLLASAAVVASFLWTYRRSLVATDDPQSWIGPWLLLTTALFWVRLSAEWVIETARHHANSNRHLRA